MNVVSKVLAVTIGIGGLLAVPLHPVRALSAENLCQISELMEYDAEILIYLLPASVASRSHGGTVRWEIQSSEKLNQKDFFVFYVYDTNAPSASSPTIGYFAVNKHTADVWDMGKGTFVESTDLDAVKLILRKGHCVNENALKEYGAKRPEIKGG